MSMDYETRCRRLADQIAAGREVPWERGVDALRGAAGEIERLRVELSRCGGENCMGRRCDDVTNWVTERAADARVAAERERCAKLCESVASDLENAEEDAQALSTGAQSCADQIRAGA